MFAWKTATIFGLVGAGCGIGITLAFSTPRENAAKAEACEQAPRDGLLGLRSVNSTTIVSLNNADKEAIRQIVREELSAHTPSNEPAVRADAPDVETMVGSLAPAQRQTYGKMQSSVDKAIARGVWTNADREVVREGVATLPAGSRPTNAGLVDRRDQQWSSSPGGDTWPILTRMPVE